MKKKILLPNNTFGCVIMLGLILASLIVPFVIALWLLQLCSAPAYVSYPTGLAAALISFTYLVRFK